MNILILGATGFIGSNILRKLSKKKNYNIFATWNKTKKFNLNKKKINWIKCDLTDKKKVNLITRNIDIVIQAAATTSGVNDIIKRPYIHVSDNVIMNANIFRSCFENNVKHLIFFSCTTMYKSSEKPLKEYEFNPAKDINEKYLGVANTKIFNEKMCEFYSTIGKTKYSAIRHSNIYGPYDKFDLKKSHVFGSSITKVMKSKNKVEIWGNGSEKRDFLYVDDLVEFVELLIKKQKKKFELINCGFGKSISIKTLVKKIINLSDKNLKIEYDLNRPTIRTNITINCDKAKKLLKWRPKTSIDVGIRKTIKWWRKKYN